MVLPSKMYGTDVNDQSIYDISDRIAQVAPVQVEYAWIKVRSVAKAEGLAALVPTGTT